MKKILVVVGTRPNFIKITQFKTAAAVFNFDLKIVHTGQHFDDNLSAIFFNQLNLHPDFFLEVATPEPEVQRFEIKTRLKELMHKAFLPDLLIVVGDVNSTRAAAEAAFDENIKIAHIESGLRSFDRTMPEEINRIITDQISTYFFITEQSGVTNLLTEGKKQDHLYLVGNTMIDTLLAFNDQIQNDDILKRLSVTENNFALVTLHRPSNVDTHDAMLRSLQLLAYIENNIPIVFPIHPRTYKALLSFNLLPELKKLKNIIITEPLGYFSIQKLISTCTFVLTDSGGLQEETTFRKKPCITLRPNTERPSTIETGTNTLIDMDLENIGRIISSIKNKTYKKGEIPPLWDGRATERIFQILAELL